MNRTLYLCGWGYVAVCGVVVWLHARPPQSPWPALSPMRPPETSGQPRPAYPGAGGEWFARMKPYCNAVEVEVRQQGDPPPQTLDGAGYSAACYALAGKIDRAQSVIEALPASDRAYAASIVFNIGHPVADAGDDASAGPIMRLVVQYQPNNYMALYHAGMSEYALGQTSLARTHLRAFLELYSADDGWRRNAQEVLGRLTAP
jgi:hypothetical protein